MDSPPGPLLDHLMARARHWLRRHGPRPHPPPLPPRFGIEEQPEDLQPEDLPPSYQEVMRESLTTLTGRGPTGLTRETVPWASPVPSLVNLRPLPLFGVPAFYPPGSGGTGAWVWIPQTHLVPYYPVGAGPLLPGPGAGPSTASARPSTSGPGQPTASIRSGAPAVQEVQVQVHAGPCPPQGDRESGGLWHTAGGARRRTHHPPTSPTGTASSGASGSGRPSPPPRTSSLPAAQGSSQPSSRGSGPQQTDQVGTVGSASFPIGGQFFSSANMSPLS